MAADAPLAPRQTARFSARLAQFNSRWGGRKAAFSRYCGGGWWGRGTVISPECRGWYNGFLPPDEYQRDLRLLALDFLGDESLVPSVLAEDAPPFLSLPDVWAVLEDAYGGRVAFEEQELLGLFCNLAEPSRMGTAAGRYPGQLERLAAWLPAWLARSDGEVRFLDLGCGVGFGTYELAATCLAGGASAVRGRGVTAEGLGAWMASSRRLPHSPLGERQFWAFPEVLDVDFRQGLAEAYRDGGRYGVIVCNGLAGGRFMSSECQLAAFLENCRGMLLPGGVVLLGNHFHEGFEGGCRKLMALALETGWQVTGNWRLLELCL